MVVQSSHNSSCLYIECVAQRLRLFLHLCSCFYSILNSAHGSEQLPQTTSFDTKFQVSVIFVVESAMMLYERCNVVDVARIDLE